MLAMLKATCHGPTSARLAPINGSREQRWCRHVQMSLSRVKEVECFSTAAVGSKMGVRDRGAKCQWHPGEDKPACHNDDKILRF